MVAPSHGGRQDLDRLLAGAAGGLVATLPMTAIMTSLFQKLPASQRYPLPPREITEEVAARLPSDRHLTDSSLMYSSLAAHFAYGAATGALYPLIFGRRRHPIFTGGSYGLAVWAASYLGWLPAARILRPATTHPPRRNGLMIVAHWVWGAGTAMVAQALMSGMAPRGEWALTAVARGRNSAPLA